MCTNEYVNCQYVINWEIQNFSFSWQKEKEGILSPGFWAESIENTLWTLTVFPIGKHGDCIGLFLRRGNDDEGPMQIDIFYDITFLKANGSVLCKYRGDRSFENGTIFGSYQFMAREDLNLPHDILTVRCRLRRNRKKITSFVEQFARTVIRVDQKSVDWNISQFSNMELDEKKSISITLTSVEDLMSLDLFLSAGECSEKTILVSISSSLKSIKFVTVKVNLKDTEGNMVVCGEKKFYRGNEEDFKIIPLIFGENKLLRKKDLYLKDDQLSLCCVCAFTTGIVHEGIRRTISGNFDSRDENTKILPDIVTEGENTGSIKDDVKSLYNDLALSDMTLRTKTKSYPAHSAMLCARSPVFKAMFKRNKKRRIRRKLDIFDLNDDTVQRMLLYMYTDTVENLQWESAFSLYKAADKYNIMSLRNQCVSFIERHLTPINVCEALLLANTHQDEDFKSILQNYIVNNQRKVLDLKEWKLFMKNNSELAAESLLKICMEE
ncbi:TD and POZ domain-containing protein 1 [Trichonephila clavipes]|nr:TD and POZ domain-containing protein 1 [Trichonephila clavipes]